MSLRNRQVSLQFLFSQFTIVSVRVLHSECPAVRKEVKVNFYFLTLKPFEFYISILTGEKPH